MTDEWAEKVRKQVILRAQQYGNPATGDRDAALKSRNRWVTLVTNTQQPCSTAQAFDKMVAEGDSFLIQLISDMVVARLQGKT